MITLIAQVVVALVVMHMILGVVAYGILLERKIAAWMQDRVGPNRVGPQGLLQPIADGVKFILKEEFIPRAADKFLFMAAPVAMMTVALAGFAIIPWGGELVNAFGTSNTWSVMAASPDIGILFVVAIAGLTVYGVVLGGWSSGSKFSFLGGLRACAQMLSYEVPMALAIMAVLVVIGTLKLDTVVIDQARYFAHTGGVVPHWNVFVHPIACFIFITAIFAETNRTPFDLPECESELVGGYHTEYSSMKFAMFFLGEYASMITGAAVAVALFFGGWHLPWLDHWIYGGQYAHTLADGSIITTTQPVAAEWAGVVLKFGVFWAKVVAFLAFYMAIRWTLPRFRFDQLMNLAWRGMIPLSLGAFLISTFVVYLKVQVNLDMPSLWLGVGNAAFFIGTLVVLRMLPKKNRNLRVAVPGSRYNPELAAAALRVE